MEIMATAKNEWLLIVIYAVMYVHDTTHANVQIIYKNWITREQKRLYFVSDRKWYIFEPIESILSHKMTKTLGSSIPVQTLKKVANVGMKKK